MNLKFCLLVISIFISNFIFAKEYLIGFGSCIDQNFPQPIWASIKDKDVDTFMFLGDNVYGDDPSGNLNMLKNSYEIQSTLFPKWLEEKKIISIWDDHDYGINDGGGDFVNKRESEKLFLEFWNIPNNDIRHSRDGLYFNEVLNIDGFKINMIVLDTRFFRSRLTSNKFPYSPTYNPNTTILGNAQWSWFEKVIEQESDLIIVLSSIQVLATEHVFEKWNLFPHERSRIIKNLESVGTKSLIISGDRHKGGLYKKGSIIELTSSSLNKPVKTARISNILQYVPEFILKYIPASTRELLVETDKLLLTEIYNFENFGLIKIDTKNKKIKISLNDISGNEIFSEII